MTLFGPEPLKPRPQSEKDFTADVVKLARMLGWKRYHTMKSFGSPEGFPDEVFVRDRVIFAELKTDVGKESDNQCEWLDKFAKAGAECYVWRPSQLQAIADILSRPARWPVVFVPPEGMTWTRPDPKQVLAKRPKRKKGFL